MWYDVPECTDCPDNAHCPDCSDNMKLHEYQDLPHCLEWSNGSDCQNCTDFPDWKKSNQIAKTAQNVLISQLGQEFQT